MVKKEVRDDMKLAFKNLMERPVVELARREMLQRLLMFFPE